MSVNHSVFGISLSFFFCLLPFFLYFCRFVFLSFQVRCDTEIAFCPWSAQPLSYLGLTGKEASLGYCQTDKLGTQYFDDKHWNRNQILPIWHKKYQLFLILSSIGVSTVLFGFYLAKTCCWNVKDRHCIDGSKKKTNNSNLDHPKLILQEWKKRTVHKLC